MAGWCLFETVLGPCGIAWDGSAIAGAQLPEADPAATRERMARRFPQWAEGTAPTWVQDVIERTRSVLEGARDDLADVPLALEEVPQFHRRVYEVTRAIQPGRTLTYGDVAREVGEPGAARAVGQALGHNPFAPIVPCHRVLAARNAGGGFSATGGVRTKLKMLEIEGARFGTEPDLFEGG